MMKAQHDRLRTENTPASYAIHETDSRTSMNLETCEARFFQKTRNS